MRVMTKHTRQLDLFRQQQPPLPQRDRPYGLVVRPSQPCRCGCELAVIGEGNGPHIASLHCAECDTHRGWVSHTAHKFLTEIVNRFGRPTEPINIRGDGAGAD
jgi:hypothetical protein